MKNYACSLLYLLEAASVIWIPEELNEIVSLSAVEFNEEATYDFYFIKGFPINGILLDDMNLMLGKTFLFHFRVFYVNLYLCIKVFQLKGQYTWDSIIFC